MIFCGLVPRELMFEGNVTFERIFQKIVKTSKFLLITGCRYKTFWCHKKVPVSTTMVNTPQEESNCGTIAEKITKRVNTLHVLE